MSRPTTPTPRNSGSAAGESADIEMKEVEAAPQGNTEAPTEAPVEARVETPVETSETLVNTTDSSAQPRAAETEASLLEWKTVLLLSSVYLSLFLVGLDRTIISTAIPKITDEFNSLPDVGWYGSSYLLTCCAFQLLFGKIYAYYSVRGTLLISLAIFEIASVICGAAPSSIAFIIGRAISGIGAAGIFAGTIISVTHTVPLAKRPKTQGILGAVMGLCSIFGPLVGGGFTSNVSWRWCFYINLPFGGVAMVLIYLFMKIPDRQTSTMYWASKLRQLDAMGTAFLVPGVVALLLALQWGGQTYSWSDSRIIVLLVVAGVLLLAFVGSQAFFPETATIPPQIMKNRTVAAGLWSTVCIGSSQYIYIYYLPVWFQAIKGVKAVDSGVHLLPLMGGVVVASIGGGLINSRIGYYNPLGLIGTVLMCIGSGLLYTLQVDSGAAKWAGYQVLYGLGMGLCFQTPNLATQTVLPKIQVPMGLALMFFGQLVGATVFVSVGQNVLDNQLLSKLAGIPGFSKELVTSGGATSLIAAVPEDMREAVLVGYNESLRQVFLVGLILSCLTILGTGSLEWRSVKKPQPRPDAETAAGVQLKEAATA